MPSPVKQLALQHEIAVYQPQTLRDPAAQAELAALKPDLLVVVAYGLILPRKVLAIPRFGCWNVHASLLPRWRGAAPIQRAIEAGDALKVFDFDGVRAGIAICYDIEFPLPVRAQCEAGARLLLVPSCTDTEAGATRVRVGCLARALENRCFVAQAVTAGDMQP